jgi:DNA-binding NarL/FixJ family response regulator
MVDFNRTVPSRTTLSRTPLRDRFRSPSRDGIREIVIVDSRIDRYGDFIEAARAGHIGLQFCEDARAALRLAGQFHADVWVVNLDQPDMSGLDLLEMVSPIVSRGSALQARGQAHRFAATAGNRMSQSRRPVVFGVADHYSPADETRSLACGVAGYLVGQVTLDGIRGCLETNGSRNLARAAS